MFSRAHLVIERDFDTLQKEKPWGIEAHPVTDENIFEWTAKIHGLKGSAWEDGVFRLYIKFDQNYNYRPPEVCFHTIPFHPNVDMTTGKPCVDFLDNPHSWRENYSLSFILLTIQSLLSNPELENAVNLEAVAMLSYSPHTYNQVVHECVVASQRVEAGLDPYPNSEKVRFAPQKEAPPIKTAPLTGLLKVGKLSFEDYHNTWSGIATSKTNLESKNTLLETIKDNPLLQTVHYGLPLEDLQVQMDRQLEEHTTLMYGKFQSRPDEEETRQQKLEKVKQMKKIYLQPRTPKTPKKIPYSTGAVDDEEVDDLVAWANELDDKNL